MRVKSGRLMAAYSAVTLSEEMCLKDVIVRGQVFVCEDIGIQVGILRGALCVHQNAIARVHVLRVHIVHMIRAVFHFDLHAGFHKLTINDFHSDIHPFSFCIIVRLLCSKPVPLKKEKGIGSSSPLLSDCLADRRTAILCRVLIASAALSVVLRVLLLLLFAACLLPAFGGTVAETHFCIWRSRVGFFVHTWLKPSTNAHIFTLTFKLFFQLLLEIR